MTDKMSFIKDHASEHPTTRELRLGGDREAVRTATVAAVLDLLVELVTSASRDTPARPEPALLHDPAPDRHPSHPDRGRRRAEITRQPVRLPHLLLHTRQHPLHPRRHHAQHPRSTEVLR